MSHSTDEMGAFPPILPPLDRHYTDRNGHTVSDMVNHPAHYNKGGIETIEYMKTRATPEEFRGHLRLTAIKYLDRGPDKGDALQDYHKARWYLNRLIKEIEDAPSIFASCHTPADPNDFISNDDGTYFDLESFRIEQVPPPQSPHADLC